MTLQMLFSENEGGGKALGSLGSFTFKKYTLGFDAIYSE